MQVDALIFSISGGIRSQATSVCCLWNELPANCAARSWKKLASFEFISLVSCIDDLTIRFVECLCPEFQTFSCILQQQSKPKLLLLFSHSFPNKFLLFRQLLFFTINKIKLIFFFSNSTAFAASFAAVQLRPFL